MKIDLFSADLKLVDAGKPESRSFRVLEFNDGLQSGFTGYDALASETMVSGRIVADYREIFPDNQILTIDTWNNRNHDAGPIIFISRTDELTNFMPRLALIQAGYMKPFYTSVSSDLHLKALSWNKAYQYHMAQQAGMGDLFPRTAILPIVFDAAAEDVADMAHDVGGDMILKPVGSAGGTGIRLITCEAATRQIKKYLNPWRFNDWPGIYDPVCLLQERVPVNEVEDKGKKYDGTMRVVFSVYGDGNERRAVVHDAYWKLPSHAMGEGKGEEDIVSFSPSNMEKKFRKKTEAKRSAVDEYKKFMDSFNLSPDQDVEQDRAKNKIHSAAVSADIREWLFPSFGGAMARYFSHVASTDYEQEAISLVSNDNPAIQGVGWMMATHPHFYPASQENITTDYPVAVRDAITRSDMISNTGSYMHHRLKLSLETMSSDSIYCKDVGKNFIRPIERAIRTSRQSIVMNAVWDMMGKMSR